MLFRSPPPEAAQAATADAAPARAPAKGKLDWAALLKTVTAPLLGLWSQRAAVMARVQALVARGKATVAAAAAKRAAVKTNEAPAAAAEAAPEPVQASAPAEAAPVAEAPTPVEQASPRAPVVDTWTPARIKVVEWLWGEGCDFPGGAEFAIDLVRPLQLGGDQTVLEIGSGLGGTTRAVTQMLGCSIRGFEPSPGLVAGAAEAARKAEMTDAARVSRLDLSDPQLPPGRVDAVVTRLAFGAAPDPMTLLHEIDRHLKPGGRLLLLEQLLGPAAPETLARDAWQSKEDRTVHPVTLEVLTRGLAELRYDVSVAEDMSPALRALVVGAWEKVAGEIEPGVLDADEIALLQAELEMWHARVGAYDAGVLKFVRVLAVKPRP